jgi:polysaccharide export outer membrane protein
MRHLLFIVLIIIFASCTQYKKIVYLQNEDLADSVKVAAIEKYKLMPGDLLHVKVYSPDQSINAMFNFDVDQNRSNYNDVSIYLSGFQLDDQSNIELPIIGKVSLQNKTMAEAQKIISDSVDSYINEAIVVSKLLSYRVTVLGEVSRTGVVNVYRHHSTIFDVLSTVGDINSLGDRRKVEVLRQTGAIKTKYIIDLTKFEAINNPAYNIYPGDIVYVKPLRAKIFRENIPIITLSLTTVTTFLLILNYLK